MTEKLTIRLANFNDAKRVWEIRSHPSARQESHDAEVIPFESHLNWFRGKYFDRSGNACFILDYDGIAVGYCRLDYDNGKYIVSIAIDPEYHGKGLGTILLGESINQLNASVPILATVKKDNPASLKIFTKNGFIEKNTDETYLYFEKQSPH